jgi:hypothetical protein
MEKEIFLKYLKDGSTDSNIQLEVCNHFIQNYPVLVDEVKNMTDPFGNIIAQFTTGNRIWTKLDIKVIGGSEEKIKFAFEQLQKRIKQFEDYDKK